MSRRKLRDFRGFAFLIEAAIERCAIHVTAKVFEELAVIATKYEVQITQEERGLPHLVPVVYDYEGNFLEFFSEDDRLAVA